MKDEKTPLITKIKKTKGSPAKQLKIIYIDSIPYTNRTLIN